jgi:hypothetical protein
MAFKLKIGYQVTLECRKWHRSDGRLNSRSASIVSQSPAGKMGMVDFKTNTRLSWSTSDSNIATVNQDGEVIGVAAGTATITVTEPDTGLTDTEVVTVVSGDPTCLSIIPLSQAPVPKVSYTPGNYNSDTD